MRCNVRTRIENGQRTFYQLGHSRRVQGRHKIHMFRDQQMSTQDSTSNALWWLVPEKERAAVWAYVTQTWLLHFCNLQGSTCLSLLKLRSRSTKSSYSIFQLAPQEQWQWAEPYLTMLMNINIRDKNLPIQSSDSIMHPSRAVSYEEGWVTENGRYWNYISV